MGRNLVPNPAANMTAFILICICVCNAVLYVRMIDLDMEMGKRWIISPRLTLIRALPCLFRRTVAGGDTVGRGESLAVVADKMDLIVQL